MFSPRNNGGIHIKIVKNRMKRDLFREIITQNDSCKMEKKNSIDFY